MASLTKPITAAVITGDHPFEVVEFLDLLCGLPGIRFYPQSLVNFADDMSHARNGYDVLLYFNMHREPPNETAKAALESLGESEHGLFFLHHGMLDFWEWPLWGDVVGVRHPGTFGYAIGETVHVQIADPEHPVTKGLSPWTMVDKVYELDDAHLGSHVLLTTDHPHSMRTLAWTRQHKRSRVFVTALGHDRLAYADRNFQTVLLKGIQWAAGRT
jgi:type 1 glutamine amidotransferase